MFELRSLILVFTSYSNLKRMIKGLYIVRNLYPTGTGRGRQRGVDSEAFLVVSAQTELDRWNGWAKLRFRPQFPRNLYKKIRNRPPGRTPSLKEVKSKVDFWSSFSMRPRDRHSHTSWNVLQGQGLTPGCREGHRTGASVEGVRRWEDQRSAHHGQRESVCRDWEWDFSPIMQRKERRDFVWSRVICLEGSQHTHTKECSSWRGDQSKGAEASFEVKCDPCFLLDENI